MTESTAPVPPLAGRLAPPPSEPHAPAPCRNCGSAMVSAFCAECGQRTVDPDPTFRELREELVDAVANFDRRLGATLQLLVTRPGALTLEFIAGRRARYWSPLRLYLAASVVYFFFAAITPTPPSTLRAAAAQPGWTRFGILNIQLTNDTTGALRWLEQAERSPNPAARLIGRKGPAAVRNIVQFFPRATATLPRAMFVLVPFFALLLRVFFRSGPYPRHLCFALHVHAFGYLALLLSLAAQAIDRLPLIVGAQFGVMLALIWYTYLAARRFYGTSRGGTVLRLAGLGFGYSMALGVAQVATLTWAVLTA